MFYKATDCPLCKSDIDVGQKKKGSCEPFVLDSLEVYYALCFFSSETLSFFLPLALRAEITLRPLCDSILDLKPCLFFLFLFDG